MCLTPIEEVNREGRKVSRSALVRNITQMARLVEKGHTEQRKQGFLLSPGEYALEQYGKRGEEVGLYFDGEELVLRMDSDAEEVADDMEDPEKNDIIACDYYRLILAAYRYTLHCYRFGSMKDDVDKGKWADGEYYYMIDELWDGPGTSIKARASRVATYVLLEEGLIPDILVKCDKGYDERDDMPLPEFVVTTFRDEMCTEDRAKCDCDFCY